jgi:hypothetical protein
MNSGNGQAKPGDICRRCAGELTGKVLMCHCDPKACHGDVLMDLIAQPAAQPAERVQKVPKQRKPVHAPETIWSFCDPGPSRVSESGSAEELSLPKAHKS